MEEKELTEKESLQIITTMIARTKQRYIGDGNIMLMWGYVCLSVTALVWIMLLLTQNPVWNWLWFLIWVIGGTLTPRLEKKRQRTIGAKSYSDKLISQIWTVVGFCSLGLTVCCLTFMLFHAYNAWCHGWHSLSSLCLSPKLPRASSSMRSRLWREALWAWAADLSLSAASPAEYPCMSTGSSPCSCSASSV